jgi:hypothetical protein
VNFEQLLLQALAPPATAAPVQPAPDEHAARPLKKVRASFKTEEVRAEIVSTESIPDLLQVSFKSTAVKQLVQKVLEENVIEEIVDLRLLSKEQIQVMFPQVGILNRMTEVVRLLKMSDAHDRGMSPASVDEAFADF